MSNLVFENPQDFLTHLETMLVDVDHLDPGVKNNLLHGSAHAIRYLISSQQTVTTKLYELILTLNSNDHESWGHRLADVYRILEAGDVTPEEMQAILNKEVCGIE
jgi:hypothetical protein